MASGQKTGGRKKGTPNKLTSEARHLLKDIIFNELENIPEVLSRMNDKERLEVVLKLLPYVLPKVQTVAMTSGEGMSGWFDFDTPDIDL